MKRKSAFSGGFEKQEFRLILTNRGQRVTATRLEIMSVLKSSKKPLTISEIHSRLENGKTDLATVYRTLNLFADLKIVSEIDFRDDFRRYELVFDRHHHHIVCRKCGRVEDVESCVLGELEKMLAEKGYTDVSHSLEFFGVCNDCRNISFTNKSS